MNRLNMSLALTLAMPLAVAGCGSDPDRYPEDDTTLVGAFNGLFDDVAVGFNYPYDIALVPATAPVAGDPTVGPGGIVVANYGTSELLLVRHSLNGGASQTPAPLYDGASDGVRGPMGVSVLPDGYVWAAFERGGAGDRGAVVVLSPAGERVALLEDSDGTGALSSPSGICFGGGSVGSAFVFVVNKGDGTVWRVSAANSAGESASWTKVGDGLATGTLGNPGTAPTGVSNKKDLPEGGARGCAYLDGRLYVADAQNARVVRFDDADLDGESKGVPLEDTPANLVTYPTGVTINHERALIVISFDNAKAFVALETPSGGFIDNGLHNLNVNSGNHAVQVGDGTIWFTRANNTNGALRALTRDRDTPPSSEGEFPAQ